MTERVHDTQFPSIVHERLSEADLQHDFQATATMVARCIACTLKRGQNVNAIDVANCVGVERTNAHHHLKNLVAAGLIEALPPIWENKEKPRDVYVASEAARPAFMAMPRLSGCEFEVDIS